MLLKKISIVLCFATLFGCGGGSDSSDDITANKIGNESGQGHSKGAGFSLSQIASKYTGKREKATFDVLNIANAAYDYLYWRDMAKFLVLSDTSNFKPSFPHFLKFQFELPENSTCETGSAEFPDFEALTEYKESYPITYKNCKVGPIVANGEAVLRLFGNDVKNGDVKTLSLEFPDTFKLYETEKDKQYTLFGKISSDINSESNYLDMVILQDAEAIVWFNNFEVDNYGFHEGAIAINDYGLVNTSSVKESSYKHFLFEGENMLIVDYPSIDTSEKLIRFGFLPEYYTEEYFKFNDTHEYYVEYSGRPTLSSFIVAPISDFQKEILTKDNGPSTATFELQNTIVSGGAVGLRPATLKAPDYGFTSFEWQIIDSTGSVVHSEEKASFSYNIEKAGEYLVKLITRDNHGNESEFSKSIVYVEHFSDKELWTDESGLISNLSEDSPFKLKINLHKPELFKIDLHEGPATLSFDGVDIFSWEGEELNESYKFADKVSFSFGVTEIKTGARQIFTYLISLPEKHLERTDLYSPPENINKKNIVLRMEGESPSLILDSGLYQLDYVDNELKSSKTALSKSVKNHFIFKDVAHVESNNTLSALLLGDEELVISNSSSEPHIVPYYADIHSPRIVDLDQDGKTELVGFNFDKVYLIDAQGEKIEYEYDLNGTVDVSNWQECDLNGDGIKEVLVSDNPSFNWKEQYLIHWDGMSIKMRSLFARDDEGDFQHTRGAALMVDEDGNGICEGVLVHDFSTSVINSMLWLKFNGTDLTVEHQGQVLSKVYQGLNTAVPITYSNRQGLLFSSTEDEMPEDYYFTYFDQQTKSFESRLLEIEASHNLYPSAGNTKILGQLDIDSDGVDEWVFQYNYSFRDPIFKNGEMASPNIYAGPDFKYISAQEENGKLVLDNVSKTYPRVTQDSLLRMADGRIALDYKYTPIIFNSEFEFENRYKAQSFIGYVLFKPDGNYYDLSEDAINYYVNGELKLVNSDVPESFFSDIYTDPVFIASKNSLDIFHRGYNSYLFIDSLTGEIAFPNSQHGGEGVSVSPHPDFSENGRIFVMTGQSVDEEIETGFVVQRDVGSYSFPTSGIYELKGQSFKLVENLQSLHDNYAGLIVDHVTWSNVDTDNLLELVVYLENRSNYLISHVLTLEQDGTGTKFSKYFEKTLSRDARRGQPLTELKCWDTECRQMLINEGNTIMAYDKVTGRLLWTRENAGKLADFDAKDGELYLWHRGLHKLH